MDRSNGPTGQPNRAERRRQQKHLRGLVKFHAANQGKFCNLAVVWPHGLNSPNLDPAAARAVVEFFLQLAEAKQPIPCFCCDVLLGPGHDMPGPIITFYAPGQRQVLTAALCYGCADHRSTDDVLQLAADQLGKMFPFKRIIKPHEIHHGAGRA